MATQLRLAVVITMATRRRQRRVVAAAMTMVVAVMATRWRQRLFASSAAVRLRVATARRAAAVGQAALQEVFWEET